MFEPSDARGWKGHGGESKPRLEHGECIEFKESAGGYIESESAEVEVEVELKAEAEAESRLVCSINYTLVRRIIKISGR